MKSIKFFLFILLFYLTGYQSRGQNLVSANLLVEKTSAEATAYLNYYGINAEGHDIPALKFYKVTYYTTDVDGNQTIASGSLTIPQLSSCNYLPMTVWHHGTEYDKTEVSSQGRGEAIVGIIFGCFGYAVAMPDYLGMGDNPGIHPYHHAETEATASIDLIRACREFMENTLLIHDNNQLFISGYSQGGHATMALHKYIQDNNLYNEFNIVASAPMSGAYELSGAQYDLVFDEYLSFYRSEFIPYILASYQLVYGNIYSSYNQIYKAPFDSIISEFLSGDYTWAQWAEMLPDNYFDFMQDSVLQNMSADINRDTHPINRALKANNLHNWSPGRTVKMLYCGLDSMVSPLNSLNTLDSMIALGTTDVDAVDIDPNGVHETCFFPSINYAINWFGNMATPCQLALSSNEFPEAESFSIYPNPAENELFIDYCANFKYKITSLEGKIIIKASHFRGDPVDISELTPGVYIISAFDIVNNKKFKSVFIKN